MMLGAARVGMLALRAMLTPQTRPSALDQKQDDQGNLNRRGRVAEQGALTYRYPAQDRQHGVSDQCPPHEPPVGH